MDNEEEWKLVKSGDMQFFQWNVTLYMVFSIMPHILTKQLKWSDITDNMVFMFSPRDIVYSIKNDTKHAIRLSLERLILKIWVYEFDNFELEKLNEYSIGYLFVSFNKDGYIENVEDNLNGYAYKIIKLSEKFKSMIEMLYCLINMTIDKPEEIKNILGE